jgi:hypothetical protein
MTSRPIADFDLYKMSNDIQEIARQVRVGNFIAIGIILCDQDGDADCLHIINKDAASPELIEEMAMKLKLSMPKSINTKPTRRWRLVTFLREQLKRTEG